MPSRIVDLTMPYTEGFPGFKKEVSKTMEIDGWNASTLTFYSHSGTHMDAPVHFNATKQTLDQIPVSDFIGKARILDLRGIEGRGLITYEAVKDQLTEFEAGNSLILWTNWSRQVNTRAYRDELPRVAEDFAEWCVENKVKMLGVEPPSVADVNNLAEVTKIHQILLGHVIIIEGLANIDRLSSSVVELVALPLKIEGGDGSPARVIAIERY